MSLFGAALNSFLSLLESSSSKSSLVKWLLQIFALSHSLAPAGWPLSYNPYDAERFDFIVVGAGSAGATLAARLSEVPSWRVLLIEAGGDPPPASVIPSLFATLAHTKADWDYLANVDKGTGQAHFNQKIFMTRGKMLGGSSSINYHIYARGFPEDYDEWAKVAPGWDSHTVFHYFKKFENMEDPVIMKSKNSYLHSVQGPVKISRPKPNAYFEEINEILLQSFEEIGITRRLEMNGPETTGVALPHFFFSNGRRSSTAEAYLIPAADRPNLFVAKYARVNKVLIESRLKKAYGVEVLLKTGEVIEVYADKEVIVSGGAINTPKILMLSGIGPQKELKKFGIDTICNLPVGLNLQEHAVIPVIISGLKGLQSVVQNLYTTSELDAYPVPIQSGFFNLNYTIPGLNLGSRPLFQFFNLHVGAAASFISYIGCRTINNYDNDLCISLAKANAVQDLDVIALILLHPLSRGRVTLQSRNPSDDPVIDLGYFRREEDLNAIFEASKYMMQLLNTTYFKKAGAVVPKLKVRSCEGLQWGNDDYWRCFARNTVSSMLHPSGTCPMGDGGVVNEKLRVHGVTGLRIVDASVMPTITSGNTNAPTIMIGERAADLIKLDYNYLVNKI